MSKTEFCEWTEDEDGNWTTECEHIFVLNEGSPVENEMQFCCFCGRSLIQNGWREK